MERSASIAGTAGRIENCQIGVFLAYAGASGRTLLDRELYLPQVWVEDRKGCREAGVPEDTVFRTKGQLVRVMLERAVESGVPFAWFTGAEVYGSDRKLRLWLEREEIPHVMAIKRSEKLWALTDKGPLQVRADRLASQVDEADWVRCSAGDGAKGPRVYDCHRGDTVPAGPGQRPLAAGQAQHCQTGGVGLLRVLWPGQDQHEGIGEGGRAALVHRGMLRGG